MATSSKEGAMLPPPNPSPPKAVLEPELDAIAICLRNATVKTNQIHAFFADTRRLGISNYVTRPPHSLTDALGREIEKYDQLCDTVEAHLSRAIAVLQRDLDRAKAQEKAEREAEALRNRPPPEPEVVADVPGPSVSGTQKSGAGSFLAARRQSTISLSSLNRPQFPHKLDLSSATLRINPAELAQGLGGLPSPVTLAPKSGRVTATSEFPPDFMAALAASDITNQPVDIDLTMLPEEGSAAAHLDLEGMDIDMTNVSVDVDVKTLFGDEPTSSISTTNLFGDTTEASLLASFNASAPHAAPVPDTSGGEPPFDMGIGEMVDFSQFQFDPMTSTSDMGMLDMNALLNIEAETAAQMDGQNSAGDT
ncbi:hypothetical protein EDB83DRAFT_2515430 [Lactarius deliciosus]|nr:hypothetical protein EDB83DRAFT_2515430 [Lactarius deliciosus]